MRKAWIRFVLWTTIIGACIRLVVTVVLGEPFFGITAYFSRLEYLYVGIGVVIFGVVFGTLFFGIWYVWRGRTKRTQIR